MYFIVETDDFEHFKIIEDDEGRTMLFHLKEDAIDYAERQCSDYVIGEVDL